MMFEIGVRRSRPAALLVALLLLAATAVAESVSGTVTNATTGKPAAGAAVALVDPMAGMAELATTKADARGHFTFNAPTANGPRLVRAERGGVNYFKMLPPGVATVDLSVYDAAPSVEGIGGSADVLRLEAQGNQLRAMELFAIKNQSNPPRALASAATFEFVLPDGAQVDGAQAQAPNGQPISVTANPAKGKNHYAFSFAIKPGETQFEVAYHMPYNGKASFSPRLTRDFDHYVLVLPASMSFAARDPKQFQPMTNQPGSNVQVSLRAQSGEDISYTVSGTGAFPDQAADAAADGGASGDTATGGGARADNRPGGGLGKPIDAPDGLAKYQWYILGALLTILVGGGIWTHESTLQEAAEDGPSPAQASLQTGPSDSSGDDSANQTASASAALGSAPQSVAPSANRPPAPSQLLLAALKEELFTLEVERQQGKLSPEEYDKARAALEQTLQRALNRTHS